MEGELKAGTILTSESGTKYTIKRFRGAGGQGEVYEVESGGKLYALKWYYILMGNYSITEIIDR